MNKRNIGREPKQLFKNQLMVYDLKMIIIINPYDTIVAIIAVLKYHHFIIK